jgi:pyridoxamine 5'-phosphate oxidase
MKQSDFIVELDEIIEDARAGLLATVDSEGAPHMRWMTPAVLKERPRAVYAVTSRNFAKKEHLSENPKVQWMFQSRSLNKIIYLNGTVNLVDNSSMLNEVLEVVGPRLRVFWNVNTDESSLIVLETIIEEGSLFLPMKGVKEKVRF